MWQKIIFVARFHRGKCLNEIDHDLKRLLSDCNFIVEEERKGRLKITANDSLFYREAELQLLMKIGINGALQEFKCEDKESFVGWNKPEFFTDSELAFLLHEMLEHLSPDPSFLQILNLSFKKKIITQNHESVFSLLKRKKILKQLEIEHQNDKRTKIWQSLALALYKMPIQGIRDYYGESLAFFYAWMNFYTLWLLTPAILGISLSIIHIESIPINDEAFIPFFALFMVIWGFFFIKYWKRATHSYAFKWNTYGKEKKLTMRAKFKGIWRQSEITGQMELYYPNSRRKLKYVVSTIVTGIMLLIAFVIMICSLNLQGYVSKELHGEPNPFHVVFLDRFSGPGAIFDPQGNIILSYVPSILHAIVIMILNQFIYSRIARRLTNWENHKTTGDYENSLILKRFIFEAFDCYISLFYLAFYELDVLRLRSELAVLFTSDCIRRLMVKTVIPFIMRALKKRRPTRNVSKKVEKPKLDLFDDYLEMVLQYGYVTLFASAFPIAAALALISNVVEMKSDAFTLSFLCQRPIVQRTRNIGSWENVLIAQTWFAVITNVFLFGFTSEQMLNWFPWLFDDIVVVVNGISSIEHQLVAGSGRYVFGLVFCVEHILVVLGLLITFTIHDVPKWIRVAIEKREFAQSMELDKLRKALKHASPLNSFTHHKEQ